MSIGPSATSEMGNCFLHRSISQLFFASLKLTWHRLHFALPRLSKSSALRCARGKTKQTRVYRGRVGIEPTPCGTCSMYSTYRTYSTYSTLVFYLNQPTHRRAREVDPPTAMAPKFSEIAVLPACKLQAASSKLCTCAVLLGAPAHSSSNDLDTYSRVARHGSYLDLKHCALCVRCENASPIAASPPRQNEGVPWFASLRLCPLACRPEFPVLATVDLLV